MATRLIALLTTAALALALLGCGEGKDPKSEAATASKSPAATPGSAPKKPKSGDFD